MKHGYWLKNVSAYLDNELSESKRKKIELHLTDCKLCQSQLSQWEKIQEIRKTESLRYPEEQVWQTISRRIRTEPVKPLRFWEDDWVARYLPNPVSAIVTAAIVVMIALGIQPYMKPQDTTTTPVTLEQYLTNGTDLSANNGTDNIVMVSDQS